MLITEYVVGFLFDPAGETVVLISKNKPAWQAGLLNGVGGKRESNETSLEAMVREFAEEAGLVTQESDWNRFALLRGGGWQVNFFSAAKKEIAQCQTRTTEPIALTAVVSLPSRRDLVENLHWLIPLAWDSHQDGRPMFTVATYPS